MPYRLCPHPNYPSNRDVAKYPNHFGYAHPAPSFSQGRYSTKREKRVPVGHSAGACMAFQVNTGCRAVVVVGVEGIYCLRKFLEESMDYVSNIMSGIGAVFEQVIEMKRVD
ncbi:hypothetical protein HOY82DRAFT_36703 [Tuber indicum]|nr:hypothetical protein HOY82DRAFT_36703 [Tuber indicum]